MYPRSCWCSRVALPHHLSRSSSCPMCEARTHPKAPKHNLSDLCSQGRVLTLTKTNCRAQVQLSPLFVPQYLGDGSTFSPHSFWYPSRIYTLYNLPSLFQVEEVVCVTGISNAIYC